MSKIMSSIMGTASPFSYGVFSHPEPGGGGGTEPLVTEPPKFPELPTFDDKQTEHINKIVAEATAKAVAEAVAKNTADIKAESEKDRKAAERKLAKDKADAEGNTAEAIRIANEEKEDARRELEKTKQEAKIERDNALKIRIAAKHKLPDGFENRLLGNNEQDWEADAVELAKGLPVKRGPDLEGGNQQTKTKEQQNEVANRVAKKFVRGL